MEKAIPRGMLPPNTDSIQEILRTLEVNQSLLKDPESLVVTLEKKGSKWPDFIGYQLYGQGLLASERVCNALTRENIGGFIATHVEFVPTSGGKLAHSEAPRYFAIRPKNEIILRVSIFHYADGIFSPWGNYLSSAKPATTPKEEPGYCRIIRPEGLDNANSILFGKFPDGFGCDRRVVELAFQERWTNLAFSAIDAAYFPRMTTPSTPQVSCSTGDIDTVWYSPLQEEALGQKLPAKSSGGFLKRFFGSR